MYEIQNNVLSIIIALILFFSLRIQVYRRDNVNKLFFYVLWANIIILAIESILLGLSGVGGHGVNIFLNIMAVLYFGFTPLVAFLCVLFLEFEIYKHDYEFKKRHIVFIAISIASIVLTILSLQGHYLFEITNDNVFLRGSINTWYTAVIYGSAMVGFILGSKRLRHMKHNDLTPLILFVLSPTIAMVFLLFFQESSLMWNAITISLLISYIFAQIKITNTDFLTGLFNRREFEYQLQRIKNNSNKNEKIFGMIIDLDDFKEINDEYGHNEGDYALIEVGQILKSSVRKQDFVSRIGGDEFAILLSAKDEDVVENVVCRIKANLEEFNINRSNKYDLKISYGYDFYDEETFDTVIDFFNHVDTKMYTHKHMEKNCKRA